MADDTDQGPWNDANAPWNQNFQQPPPTDQPASAPPTPQEAGPWNDPQAPWNQNWGQSSTSLTPPPSGPDTNPSPMAVAARSFAENVAPASGGAAGMMAGAAIGGTVANLPGAIIGGLLGGMGAGYVVSKGEQYLLDKLGLSDSIGQQDQADAAAHPWAQKAGEVLSYAPTMGMGAGLQVAKRLMQGTAVAGIQAATDYAQGKEFNPTDVATAFATGAIFPRNREPFERAVLKPFPQAVRDYALGRHIDNPVGAGAVQPPAVDATTDGGSIKQMTEIDPNTGKPVHKEFTVNQGEISRNQGKSAGASGVTEPVPTVNLDASKAPDVADALDAALGGEEKKVEASKNGANDNTAPATTPAATPEPQPDVTGGADLVMGGENPGFTPEQNELVVKYGMFPHLVKGMSPQAVQHLLETKRNQAQPAAPVAAPANATPAPAAQVKEGTARTDLNKPNAEPPANLAGLQGEPVKPPPLPGGANTAGLEPLTDEEYQARSNEQPAAPGTIPEEWAAEAARKQDAIPAAPELPPAKAKNPGLMSAKELKESLVANGAKEEDLPKGKASLLAMFYEERENRGNKSPETGPVSAPNTRAEPALRTPEPTVTAPVTDQNVASTPLPERTETRKEEAARLVAEAQSRRTPDRETPVASGDYLSAVSPAEKQAKLVISGYHENVLQKLALKALEDKIEGWQRDKDLPPMLAEGQTVHDIVSQALPKEVSPENREAFAQHMEVQAMRAAGIKPADYINAWEGQGRKFDYKPEPKIDEALKRLMATGHAKVAKDLLQMAPELQKEKAQTVLDHIPEQKDAKEGVPVLAKAKQKGGAAQIKKRQQDIDAYEAGLIHTVPKPNETKGDTIDRAARLVDTVHSKAAFSGRGGAMYNPEHPFPSIEIYKAAKDLLGNPTAEAVEKYRSKEWYLTHGEKPEQEAAAKDTKGERRGEQDKAIKPDLPEQVVEARTGTTDTHVSKTEGVYRQQGMQEPKGDAIPDFTSIKAADRPKWSKGQVDSNNDLRSMLNNLKGDPAEQAVLERFGGPDRLKTKVETTTNPYSMQLEIRKVVFDARNEAEKAYAIAQLNKGNPEPWEKFNAVEEDAGPVTAENAPITGEWKDRLAERQQDLYAGWKGQRDARYAAKGETPPKKTRNLKLPGVDTEINPITGEEVRTPKLNPEQQVEVSRAGRPPNMPTEQAGPEQTYWNMPSMQKQMVTKRRINLQNPNANVRPEDVTGTVTDRVPPAPTVSPGPAREPGPLSSNFDPEAWQAKQREQFEANKQARIDAVYGRGGSISSIWNGFLQKAREFGPNEGGAGPGLESLFRALGYGRNPPPVDEVRGAGREIEQRLERKDAMLERDKTSMGKVLDEAKAAIGDGVSIIRDNADYYKLKEEGKPQTTDTGRKIESIYDRVTGQTKEVYEKIRTEFPELKLPVWSDSHVSRVRVGGDGDARTGSFDPVLYDSNRNLSFHPGELDYRKYYSFVDQNGVRRLFEPIDGGIRLYTIKPNVKDPTKQALFAKDYAIPSLGKENLEDLVGRSIKDQSGNTFTVDHAHTEEINDHFPKMQYVQNLVLAAVNQHLGVMTAYRNLQEFKFITQHPKFKAITLDNMTPEEARAKGYVQVTDMPDKGLNNKWLPAPIARVLNAYGRPGFNALDSAWLDHMNKQLTKLVFSTPFPHMMNEGIQWFIQRGFKWLNPAAYDTLTRTMARAIESVNSQDHIQDEGAAHGLVTMYDRVLNQDFYREMFRKMGHEVQDPALEKAWNVAGVKPAQLVQWWYKNIGQKPMWYFNAVIATQQYLEHMENMGFGGRKGAKYDKMLSDWEAGGAKGPQPQNPYFKGTRAEAADIAAKKSHDFVSDYRIPTVTFNNPKLDSLANFVLKVVRSPNWLMFGRYRGGLVMSAANMVKKLAGPNSTSEDRVAAMGNILAMAALGYGIQPLLNRGIQWATGNDQLELSPGGLMREMRALSDWTGGKKNIGDTVRMLAQPAPMLTGLFNFAQNKDWRGQDIATQRDYWNHPEAIWQNIGQEAGNAASQIAPVNTLMNAYQTSQRNGGGLGEAAARALYEQLGMKEKTFRQERHEGQQERLNEQAAQRRYRNPANPVEGAFNWLSGH